MEMKRLAALLFTVLVGAAVHGQSPEERRAARDIVARKSDAVVVVTATLKIRANVGGQEQVIDQQAQANATVLDATGLTVLSLSTLQPDDMMTRSLSARMRPDTRVDVRSEPSAIVMHLAGGREVPAKLVLRDQDLDLAFIKPSEPPSPALTFIDSPPAKAALLDLVFVIQRTSETSGWATAATFGSVQLVIDKPRLYYQIAMAGSGSGLGSPVFDAAGRFVGVIVTRSSGSRGPSLTGVLPADEILEIAKQAK
jgi:S1-C subfamily serine protease